jgi:WD40 repeat protein
LYIVTMVTPFCFSANRNGSILLLDPRTPNMIVTELIGHKREVCGLQIAEGTSYIASGGDEGIVCIWELKTNSCYKEIVAHTACSKVC